MKTLTEFSALVLRKAAAARAKAPARAAAAVTAAPATEAEVPAPQAEGETPANDSGAAPAEAAPAAPVPDPAIDTVATELAVQPDRAARLLEALDVIGGDLDRVRLVRVYQGEKGPTGSISRGEFHYVIDRVAAPARRGRDDRGGRDDRRGGRPDRGERRGGDRDKPRGLGSLKAGAAKDTKDPRDERPGRGEMPRAGIGWQLTSAPRTFDREGGKGRGRGPKRGRPGGPEGERRPRGAHEGDAPRGAREGDAPHGRGRRGRGPRDEQAPRQVDAAPRPPRDPNAPPREKRPRKPIGPDANGLGPDGTPWDPERRAKKLAEREARQAERQAVNAAAPVSVEAVAAPSDSPAEQK